jgi:hypothetical protein
MKQFYIETDRLTQMNKILRFVYVEDNDGVVSFVKVIDPQTNDELALIDMKNYVSDDALLNITTSHHALSYAKVYF